MATTVVGISNMGLMKLGVNLITAMTEDSKEAVACNFMYEHSRDQVLRQHEWNCAINRQELAQLGSTPITEDYDYQYQLPVTPYCLRVLNLPDAEDATYRIEGRALLTSETTVILRYTGRVLDPTDFDSLLTRAIAFRLAADVAFHITQSRGKESEMEQIFQMVMMEAKGIDSLERSETALENTEWLDAGR